MYPQEVVDRVNEVFHNEFEIPTEKLVPDANLFEKLGLDSLDAVDMLVHIEDKLGIRVSSEQMEKLKTLNDVYLMVHELTSNASSAIDR